MGLWGHTRRENYLVTFRFRLEGICEPGKCGWIRVRVRDTAIVNVLQRKTEHVFNCRSFDFREIVGGGCSWNTYLTAELGVSLSTIILFSVPVPVHVFIYEFICMLFFFVHYTNLSSQGDRQTGRIWTLNWNGIHAVGYWGLLHKIKS